MRLIYFFLIFGFATPFAEEIHRCTAESYTLILHKNPFFYHVQNPQGEPIVSQATIEVNQRSGYNYTRTITQQKDQIQVELNGPEGTVILDFFVFPHFLQIQSQLTLKKPLKNFSPFRGTVAFAPNAQTRFLENGFDYYYDYYPRVIPGQEKANSNWSLLVTDTQQKSLFLGFLEHFQATAQVFSSPSNASIAIEVLLNYDPRRENFPCQAEPFILVFDRSPFNCLKQVGKILAKHSTQLGYYSWFGPPPDGWNSYQGGPDFGGYGESISEPLILENLNAMSKNLAPFGMRYFQIAQGWETQRGDWTPDPKKFPNGMKAMAYQIRKQGLIPGLSLCPFVAHENSELYRTRKNWFVSKSLAGRLGSPKELMILDISHPDVKAFILEKIRQVTQDWGFQYIYLEDTYWALFGTRFFEKKKTSSEIYVQLLREIRQQLPENVFLSSLGIVGLNYYWVHGFKSNLDNVPLWEQPELAWKGRGLKETYRVLTRRYYLQNGFFLHNPDLLYFRAPLTKNQSLCYVQAVGYSGGMVKIGEPLTQLKKEENYAIGALIPSYNQTGTPIDLFEKEYPECWVLPLENRLHVGFWNWGNNIDIASGKAIPSQNRQHTFDLSKYSTPKNYHLVEFWSERYFGTVTQQLQYELPPQQAVSFTLTPVSETPTLIHSNRHLFLYAPGESAIFEENRLSLQSLQVRSFPHHFIFYVPDSWRFVQIEGLSGEVKQDGNLLHIHYTGKTTTLQDWALTFESKS